MRLAKAVVCVALVLLQVCGAHDTCVPSPHEGHCLQLVKEPQEFNGYMKKPIFVASNSAELRAVYSFLHIRHDLDQLSKEHRFVWIKSGRNNGATAIDLLNRRLTTRSTTEKHWFISEYPRREEYRCDNGYTLFKSHRTCYQVHSILMGWNDAVAFCKNKGGFLSTFVDEAEFDFVIDLIVENDNFHDAPPVHFYWNAYWTGLRTDRELTGSSNLEYRRNLANHLYNTDGSPLTFHKFPIDEPNGNGLENERCVQIFPWKGQHPDRYLTYNDYGCIWQMRGFVCQRMADQT